jgi:hypothetical protein
MCFRTVLSALLLVAVMYTPTSAQSFLYAAAQRTSVNRPALLEIPLTTAGIVGVSRFIEVADDFGSNPRVTYDGRFVVWLSGNTLNTRTLTFFDRQMGVLGDLGTLWVGSAFGVLADPRALRVFVINTDGLTVIDSQGPRFVSLPGLTFGTVMALSTDGSELFWMRRILSSIASISVVNPMTGTLLRTLEFPADGSSPYALAISPDNRSIYLTNQAGGETGSIVLRKLDAATGNELRRTTFAPAFALFPGSAVIDDLHRRVYVPVAGFELGESFGRVLLFDEETFNVLGQSPANRDPYLQFDESQGIMVNWGTRFVRNGCVATTIEVWREPVAPIQSTDATLPCARTTIATPPRAPVAFTHQVTGSRVTLSWSPTMRTTEYLLEVGTASGAVNLGTLRVLEPTLTANGIPSGTYFVRVRAVNTVGVSATSNELRIVVP